MGVGIINTQIINLNMRNFSLLDIRDGLLSSSNYILTDEQSLWIEDTTKLVYQVSDIDCGQYMYKLVGFVCVLLHLKNQVWLSYLDCEAHFG